MSTPPTQQSPFASALEGLLNTDLFTDVKGPGNQRQWADFVSVKPQVVEAPNYPHPAIFP